ncbi:hypothetical protein ABT030_03430 [Streptomyces mirabilis]|uniref:hypothetical protein n=1 Tax=Streptomyces mirabilis TaxID=68239 RepID=UPI00331F631E
MTEKTTQPGPRELFGDVAPALADYSEITHMAFYAGWPKAMSALTVARAVFRAA